MVEMNYSGHFYSNYLPRPPTPGPARSRRRWWSGSWWWSPSCTRCWESPRWCQTAVLETEGCWWVFCLVCQCTPVRAGVQSCSFTYCCSWKPPIGLLHSGGRRQSPPPRRVWNQESRTESPTPRTTHRCSPLRLRTCWALRGTVSQ